MTSKTSMLGRLGEHALVVVLFTILTLVLTYPLVFNLTTSLPGDGGDAPQYIWDMWHVHNAVVSGAPLYYTNSQFYPIGSSLTFHSLTLTNTLFLGFPLILITHNLVLIYNILFIFNFVLAGYGMYLLARYLTKNKLAAFIAGFAYTFAPLHMGFGLGWLNLLSTGWIPLFFLFFVKLFDERKLSNAFLAAVFLFFLALSDYNLLFITFILSVCYFVYRLIAACGRLGREFWADTVVFLLTFVLIITPFVAPIVSEYAHGGVQPYLLTPHETFLSPIQYILPNMFNPLWGKLTFDIDQAMEPSTYPQTADVNVSLGYIILLISAVYFFKERRHVFWLITAGLFLIFSLNPLSVVINALLGIFPILKALRDFSRFSLGVMFALTIFFSYALAYFLPKLKKFKLPFAAFVFGAVVLEFVSIPFPLWYAFQKEIGRLPFTTSPLAAPSDDYTVLSLPAGSFHASSPEPFHNSHELYLQTFWGKPILGGYLARENSSSTRSQMLVQTYINENRAQELRKFLIDNKVRYIVLYGSFLTLADETQIRSVLSQTGLPMKEVGTRDGTMTLPLNRLITGFSSRTTVTLPNDFDNTRILELD